MKIGRCLESETPGISDNRPRKSPGKPDESVPDRFVIFVFELLCNIPDIFSRCRIEMFRFTVKIPTGQIILDDDSRENITRKERIRPTRENEYGEIFLLCKRIYLDKSLNIRFI